MSDKFEPGALAADTLSNAAALMEEPTCQLKFVDGRLHQLWWITVYQGGMPRSRNSGWRPVPSESTAHKQPEEPASA